MSEGWDWDAIARSDYPIVTHPGALRRDMVYCEFWRGGGGVTEPYHYVTGLVISWDAWLKVRETPAGSTLEMDLSEYGLEGAALYPFLRARFGVWAAPMNPRFPRQSIAVWSLEGGFF